MKMPLEDLLKVAEKLNIRKVNRMSREGIIGAILYPEKILQIKLMSPYWFIPSQKLRKS